MASRLDAAAFTLEIKEENSDAPGGIAAVSSAKAARPACIGRDLARPSCPRQNAKNGCTFGYRRACKAKGAGRAALM